MCSVNQYSGSNLLYTPYFFLWTDLIRNNAWSMLGYIGPLTGVYVPKFPAVILNNGLPWEMSMELHATEYFVKSLNTFFIWAVNVKPSV